MSKMRIHEYAKANQVQSKQLIEKLKSMGVEVSNHMSTVEEETLGKAKQSMQSSTGKDQKTNQPRPQGQSQGQGGNRSNQSSSSSQGNRSGGNRPGAQGAITTTTADLVKEAADQETITIAAIKETAVAKDVEAHKTSRTISKCRFLKKSPFLDLSQLVS